MERFEGPYGTDDCSPFQVPNAHQLTNYTRPTGRHTAGKEGFSEAPTAVTAEDDFLCNHLLVAGRGRGPVPAPSPGDPEGQAGAPRGGPPANTHACPGGDRLAPGTRALGERGPRPRGVPQPASHLHCTPVSSRFQPQVFTLGLPAAWTSPAGANPGGGGLSRNVDSRGASPHPEVKGAPRPASRPLTCWFPSARSLGRLVPSHPLAGPQPPAPGWESGGTGGGLGAVLTHSWAPRCPGLCRKPSCGPSRRRQGPRRAGVRV